MIQYFSDEELGKKEPNSEDITYPVWNGLVAVFEKYSQNNSFSGDFPKQCPDGQGIGGFDRELFEDQLKAEIPGISVPIQTLRLQPNSKASWEEEVEVDYSIPTLSRYPILDFLQFCYFHIQDPSPIGEYHSYHRHYHLEFRQQGINRKAFSEEVNRIFERNGNVFYLDDNGQIKRRLPSALQKIFKTNFKTSDPKLNELLHEATTNIILPKIEDRQRGLEKLWDAFERAKTFYGEKKKSIEELLDNIAKGNSKFKDLLNYECKTLTEIGNNFQIRHFETHIAEISDPDHIDYLFYRMFSMINLFMSVLEK